MVPFRALYQLLAVLSIIAVSTGSSVFAQSASTQRTLITQSIDETQLVTLAGNTRKEMTFANDRGAVADHLVLEMYLQLNRAPKVQQDMDDLVNQLHDPKSAQYHKWLTVDEIATRFGPADEDIQAVTRWLGSHGFTVNIVYPSNGAIDFSGPASAIRETFHTEIHKLLVNGRLHMANASDPKIPAALAAAVHGVVSLNDFRPRAMNRGRIHYTFPDNSYQSVVPDDLYTIYDFYPLYLAGITGEGQTIVAVEDSDVYSTADWQVFRDTFGLTKRFPHGSFTQIHPRPNKNPTSGATCLDPGVTADDFESILDAEWASAAAPNARIVLAACADTPANLNSGVLIALQNLLAGNGLAPAIVSDSYGGGEAEDGASYNSYIRSLYEVAVLQGVSLFVASGDGGADDDNADLFVPAATHGINAIGFGSTPFNVAVGGTDFSDLYLGVVSTYWSGTNGKYYESALSYVPEIPWNDSCAGQLSSSYNGYATTYGSEGFCNSGASQSQFGDIAGSGAPSACAYGAPSIPGVVSGTCRGYEKPIWQRLVRGIPNDGVRDLPDVSLFAADGIWGHYYIACYSDPTPGYFGAPCVGAPANWAGGGGTSFASPIMAGIQALTNEATGERQGNPDFVYYALAALEYDVDKDGGCNATLGNQTNPHCIFHDVTLGDNVVDCLPLADDSGATIGTFNCYIPSGTYGVMSLSNTSYEPAFEATPGWDFATGLGSVDAYNLIKSWPGSRLQ